MQRTLTLGRPRRRDVDFEAFVVAYSTQLLRAAKLLTGGDHAIAEDLLQTTLMRTARRWQSAKSAPEAYARRVLINLSRDQHRRGQSRVREQPFPERGGELVGDGQPHADDRSRADGRPSTPSGAYRGAGDDHADAVVGRDAVIAALAGLPARQREVLVLRFYADLSVAETAFAMGASEGTVKSYTSRALARMRELLADPFVADAEPPAVEVPK
jgi:RNA polymerase sigma factor (sigma-70 family)